MATSSSRRTSGPVLLWPISPEPPRSSSAPFASSSIATAFSSSTQSPSFSHHQRSASPTRINVGCHAAAARSQAITCRPSSPAVSRKSCMCAPTTQPGSFQCRLHSDVQIDQGRRRRAQAAASPSNRLCMRRSAMTNSLLRIGAVEGDLVRRALASLRWPRSQRQRRREGFQRRPSRLSIMSKADD